MPRWFLCLCRWARLHAIKEHGRDRLRYAYIPERLRSAYRAGLAKAAGDPVPAGGAAPGGGAAERARVEALEPRLLFSGSPMASSDVFGVAEDDPGSVLDVLLNDEEGAGGALSLTGFVPGTELIGDINRGMLGKDSDSGTAYLMYTVEATQSRFTGIAQVQADHLITVKFDGSDWLFMDYIPGGTGDVWTAFTPVASDLLVAEVTMQAADDAVASLEGQSFVVEGIEAGYASGDLVFIANQYDGVYNRDEYSATGTTFTRNLRTEHGHVVDNGDGTLTYTPDAGFTGRDGFRYTASDGQTYTVSASDLEVHYALNKGSGTSAVDDSVHNRTLTLDGAGWTDGRASAFGSAGGWYALLLDGVDDFAHASGFTSTSQMTLSAWIRPDALGGEQTIVGQSGAFAFKLSGSQLRFTAPGVADHTVGVGVADVVAGQWQHVAVSFDAGQAGGAKFYLNGELVATLDASAMSTNGNDLWIGKNQWGQFFAGAVDDVRIDSRLLTADEVATLAEASIASVSLSVNASVDIEAARDTLLAGVTSLADPTQPGHMVVYGPTAFSVSNYAGADLSDPMIAAAVWGAGRVVALPDHQWLELGMHGGDASTAAFYGNGIEWLADSASLGVKVVTYNHVANASWLTAQGYTNVVNATSATLAAELADADVLVAGWLGTNPPEADLDTIRDFVANQGGGLFIAEYAIGYDWWWGQATEDIPGNRLLREAGIGFVKAYPHGGGGQTISRATGQVTAGDILALLDDSSGATEAQKAEAAAIYSTLNGLLAEDDVLQAQLDEAFWARIGTINPTPSTPVSDTFEKALLRREMDLLGALAPADVTAHRTAEDVYGAIDAGAARLTNQSVTVDADTTGLIATGLYAAPGELITVTLPAALVGQGYQLRINNHVDSIAGHGSYARVPYNVSRSFAIDAATVEIANAFGGHIYLDMGGQAGGTSSGLGSQQLTIDGAIAAPMFVLGQTTDAQWVSTLRDNPAPYAEFVSQHLAFSVPSAWVRTLDNPTALMQYWDDAVSFMDYVAGTESLRTGPDRINLDVAISVGLLHAGYPIQGPTSYGSSIVDLDTLTAQGDWGWFHELGHEIQRQTALNWGWDNPWTFGGDVEVTVNIFANAALELLAPGTGTAGWGYSAHAEEVMARAVATINDAGAPDFDQKDPYPFYFQLADGFGWDMYRTVLGGYVDDAQNNPSNLPQDDQQEKDQWLTRWSEATGYNLVDYMVNHWGLEVSQSAIDAVNAMSLPSWLPVVPGDTTYRVAHAGSLILDPDNAGLALDSTATFVGIAGSATGGTSVKGGTVTRNANGSFTYTPDAGFVGIDLIDVTYQSSAGNTVTTAIRVEVYQLAAQPDKAQWTLVSVDSEETVGENGAAVNAFDGDPNTLWHTQWQGGAPAHPHALVIDLGGRYDLDGFTYTPRQSGANGRIADYEFYVSNDGIDWGSAVATGTFLNSADAQGAAFASTTGRYIRLVALSEVNSQAFTSVAELDVSGTLATPDANDFELVSVSSEETVGENGAATNAFDGDPNTIWHSQYIGGVDTHPHELVLDLGARFDLDGFTYLPRQSGVNGRIADYAFYVSTDGIHWGTAVATGTFANTPDLQSVGFASTTGQFVKLVAQSEVNGGPWASVAELGVSGVFASAGEARPTAQDDVFDVLIGEVTDLDIAANDIDPDRGDTLSIQIIDYPSHGSAYDNGYGGIAYSHASGLYGTDTLTYTVTDSTGRTSDPATVTLHFGGLISHWKLDEATGTTAADSEANNADGTIANAQWTAGVHGSALTFNGQDSVVTLGTDASLDGTTDFTVAAWINTTDTNGGTIIQQRASGSPGYQGQYRLRMNEQGQLQFLIYNNNQYQFNFTTAQSVNDGRWHHVVAQRDGLEGRIYIDGVLAASVTGNSVQPLNDAIAVAIGADIRDNGDFFKGAIDDVQLHSRSIDAAEADALYQAMPNLAPAATTDHIATAVDTAAILSPLDNDFDHNPDDTLSIHSFTQGAHGTVTDNGDGTLTYTPDTGFGSTHAELDTFTYTVSDGNGGTTAATVLVSVGDLQTPNDFATTGGTAQSTATGNHQYELTVDFTAAPTTIEHLWIDWGNGTISHGTSSGGWGPDLDQSPAAQWWTATQHVYDEDQVQHIQVYAADINGNIYQSNVTLDGTQTPIYNVNADVYSDREVRLTWAERMTGEAGFQVSVSTDGGQNYSVLGTTAPNATAFMAQGLEPGSEAIFQVEAIAGSGGGGLFSAAATSYTAQLDPAQPGAGGRWYIVNIPVSEWIEQAPTTGYTHIDSNIFQTAQIVTDWLDSDTVQLGWEVVWASSPEAAIIEAIDSNSTYATIRRTGGYQEDAYGNAIPLVKTFRNPGENGAFQVGTVGDLTDRHGHLGFDLTMLPEEQYVVTLEDTFEWTGVDNDYDDWYWQVEVQALDFYLTVEDPRDVNGARGVSVVEGDVGQNAGELYVPLDVNDEADLNLTVGLVQNLNAAGYGVIRADEQFFIDRLFWGMTNANQSTAPNPLPEPFANANPAAVTLLPAGGPENVEYVVSAQWDFTYEGEVVTGTWAEVETQTLSLQHITIESLKYIDAVDSTSSPNDAQIDWVGVPVTDQDALHGDLRFSAQAAGDVDAETFALAQWEIREIDTANNAIQTIWSGGFNADGSLTNPPPPRLMLNSLTDSTRYLFVAGLDVNGDGMFDAEADSRFAAQAFLYYFNIRLNALPDPIEEVPPGRWIEANVGNDKLVPLDVRIGYLGMPSVVWTLTWSSNVDLLWYNTAGDLVVLDDILGGPFASTRLGHIEDIGGDGHEVFYVRGDQESDVLGQEEIIAEVAAGDTHFPFLFGLGGPGDATDRVVLTAFEAEANLNLIIPPQTELNEEDAPKYVPLNDAYDDDGADGTISAADPDLVAGFLSLTSDASGYLEFDKPDNLSFWVLTADLEVPGIGNLLHSSHSLPGATPLVTSGAYTRLDEGLHLKSLNSGTWTFDILVEGLEASPNNTSHLVTASYVYDSTNQPLDADSVRLIVSGVDLDVDSDNTNALSLPDLSEAEDLLEEDENDDGKVVYLADSLAERYTPMYLSMLAVQAATDDGTFRLTYNDADSGGPLRILTIDGTYLAPGVHDLSVLDIDRNQNDTLLWIEVVDNGQPPVPETIRVDIDPDGPGIEAEGIFSDTVRVIPRFDLPDAAIYSHANSAYRSVISSDTAVFGMVDDDGDELTGWQLLLVPVNVHEGTGEEHFVVASSTAEAPGSAADPALLGTIQPALLDDGMYQLRLVATDYEKDDNGTMVPDFDRGRVVSGHLIQIQNGLHQQVFVHPETDLVLDVPGLPTLTLGRYYDASQSDVDHGLGYGWSLTLPQARITRLAELAGEEEASAGLRRGDLITALIPGRGQVSFAFEPREIDSTPGAEVWEPRFVSIDGSGSALGFAWDDAAYRLVQQDGEFFVEELDGLQRTLAYDPADGTLPGSYRITMLDGWSYTVDFEAELLTSATDAFGNTVAYSDSGISAGGQAIHIERDADTGRILWASTDPTGNGPKVTFGYDIVTGDLTSVTDEAGRTTYYTYDAEHRLTVVTDTQGVEQIAVAYEPDGRVSSIDRLATDREPGVVPEGAEYVYNERNELVRIIQAQFDGQGGVTGYSIGAFTYEHVELDDADFEPVYRSFDLDGVTYRYTEAAFIRTVKQSTWLPFEITGADPDGLRFTQAPTVKTGEVTFRAWPEDFDGSDLSLLDHLGVPVQQARLAADGKTWLIGDAEYNHATNQATTTTDPYGNIVTNTYDVAGNLVEVLEVDPDGNVLEHLKHVYTAAGMTSYTYALDGTTADVSHLAAGLWLETVRVLDETSLAEVSLGRNVYYGSAAPAGSVGRLALATDRDGVSTRYTYWADGNVKEVFREWTEGGNFVSVRERYAEYNAAGQITLSEDVFGNPTHYHYDALGRSLAVEDRFGGYTFSTYDARGNLIRRITPAGIETRWAYNDDNLLTHVSDSFVSESAFTFDPQQPGLTLAWDTASSTTLGNDAIYAVTEYLYDSLDRSIGTVRHENASIQISIDTVPSVNSTLAPAGLQLLETAADLSSATTLYTTSTHYDGAGRVVETVGAAGLRRGTIYNNAGFAVYSGVLKSTAPAPGSGVALTLADFESATEFRYDAWNQDRIVLDGAPEENDVVALAFSSRQGDQQATVSVTVTAGQSAADAMNALVTAINASGDPLVQQVTAALDSDDNIQLTLDLDADFLLTADITDADAQGDAPMVYADGSIRSNWSRDANGHTTLDILNDQGRVIKTVYHDGTFTETPVDTLGQPITRPDLDTPGTIPTTELDGTHAVATVQRDGTDPVLATHSLYDGSGNLSDVWLPAVNDPVDTSPTYNTLVRPHYQYEYNLHGDVTAITDPNGNRTEFTYDDLGRQTSRTLPIGVATPGDPDDFTETRHFDDTPIGQIAGNAALSVGSGQLEYAVDFEGRVTAYRYDNTATGRGRLAARLYYNTEADYLADAADGDLLSAARSVLYTYNAFGQVLQANDSGHGSGGGVTDFVYDELGRRTQIASPEGILNYAYNDLNQVTRVWTSKTTAGTDAVTDTTYTYDAYGRLETVTAVERADVLVSPSGGGDTTTYFYDAVGNLDAQSVENGTSTVTTDYVFDALNRLTALYHFEDGDADQAYDAGTETLHASFVYTLDSRGNRTQSVDTIDGDTYTYTWAYDALNRLVSEQLDASDDALDYTDTFVYDLAGNRLSRTRDQGSDGGVDRTTTYTYDANDRLLTEVLDVAGGLRGGDTTTTYTYDGTQLIGKTMAATVGGKLHSVTIHTYNVMGRLASTTETRYDPAAKQQVVLGTTVTDYTYNRNGLRVTETTTTDGGTPVVKSFLFDPRNPTGFAQVLEEYIDGVLDQVFTLGHDVIAQADVSDPQDPDAYTLVSDGHGSTRALIDELNAIVQQFAYDAYGNLLGGANLTTAATALTTLLYSGEWTQQNGSQYLRARFYDPASGRFNRLDPFIGNRSDPQSLHKYLYTHANPVMGVDPSGQWFGVATLRKFAFSVAVRAVVAYQRVVWMATGFVFNHQLAFTIAVKTVAYIFAGLNVYGLIRDPNGWMIDFQMGLATNPYPDEFFRGSGVGIRAAGDDARSLWKNTRHAWQSWRGFRPRGVNPVSRLPRSNGSWTSGVPGNGTWKSDKPEVNAVTGGRPVEFVDGRPNFTPWERGRIKFERGQLDGSQNDFNLVYDYIAQQRGLPSRNAAKNYLRDAGLTPHHLDNRTIQLVPSDLHNNIPHVGSASDLRGNF